MRHFLKISLLLFLCALLPAVAKAEASVEQQGWGDRIDLDARLTLQYLTEENNDLGTRAMTREQSVAEQFQLLVDIELAEDLQGFVHGRALNIDGDSGFEDEDSGRDTTLTESFLELRELYIQKYNLLGIVPLSLQVGRQRVREERALWWNSDNDLVRLNYDSTLLSGFLAAGENFDSYRTGAQNEFEEEEKERFRVLGEVLWQYKYNHFLEGRFLYEDDHSGLEPVGSLIKADDRDDEDQNLLWAGIRSTGYLEPEGAFGFLKYRGDLMFVTGEEDLLNSAFVAGNTRSVTGSRNRDVWGWAFDGGIVLDPAERGGIVFTLGYAFGSGDDNPADGTDNEFRQTDIQANASRIVLERPQQKNYGEVLDPELANLHVASVGASYPFTKAAGLSLTYFHYRLDEEALRLRESDISAPLNGTDKDIGQALDLMFDVDLDDQFSFSLPWVRDVDFRIRAGSFFAGDAYGLAADEMAFRIFTEIKFRF